MKLRLALLLVLLSALPGCTRSPDPAPAAAPAAVAAAAPAEELVHEPDPAADPASAPLAAIAEPVAAAGAAVEGRDYLLIAGGKPMQPVSGKIEVVEFFNYVCPACDTFNPTLQQWKAKLPADVRLVYVPADFRPDFVPYARAYYAAESFGLVEKSHEAVYKGIHVDHSLPGEGDAPDYTRIAEFYAQYGIGAELFEGAMRSFAVDTKLRQGRDFMMRSQVSSTPSLVIDGKYLVKGATWDDMLRITDDLIARQRRAR